MKHLLPLLPRGVVAGAALTLGLFIPGQFAGTGPAMANEMKAWQQSIGKLMAAKHVYPRSAILREIEGVARVKITIDRSGAITNYEVVEPTGQAVLDNAISKYVDRLNPLPAPPDSLDDANLTFILPLSWRLQ